MTEPKKAIRSTITQKRESEERPQTWSPANILPSPDPVEGIRFKWVRVSSMGQDDPMNYSKKIREGWTPVPVEEVPELQHLLIEPNKKFEGKMEVGGLLLCKMPEHMAQQRQDHYLAQSRGMMESVDNSLMRESDPRMPINAPQRQSRSTFGSG
jgi:hypothetical protein